MKPEWIKTGIAAPGVIIASDGMPYAKLAHPRTGGTFSRVLGKYVREEKVIDHMGTFEHVPAFSQGIQYVLVNGVVVLKNGNTVENVFAGQPVYGKFKN